MSDKRISELDTVVGTTIAANDVFPFLDKSDTTSSGAGPGGTDKGIPKSELDTLWQPYDADLAAIAALASQTAFGRAFLALADAEAARTYVGAARRQVDIITVAMGATVIAKPSWANTCTMSGVGSGGTGGSGRKGAAGTIRCAGGAGGGGAYDIVTYACSDLPANLLCTILPALTGGASQTVNSSNGANGNNGGAGTIVDNAVQTKVFLRCNGGSFGAGGTATTGTGANGGVGMFSGGAGSAASTTGLVGVAGAQTTAGAGGGGSGGGITAANVASAGGNGGVSLARGGAVNNLLGGAIGTDGQTAAAAGAPVLAASAMPGHGGAGGGSSVTGNAGSGSAGVFPGGGGGSGGAAQDATGNSGAGGMGADGILVVEWRG